MRLISVHLTNVPPIQQFSADGLSSIVVVAGPNGVGKTSLFNALINAFRSPGGNPQVRLRIAATSPYERKTWGKDELDTSDPGDAQLLGQTLHRSQRRSKSRSTVLTFESDRSISQVKPFGFGWDYTDPWDEEIGWDMTFSFLKNRWQDTVHSIFRMVAAQRQQIASKAVELQKKGQPNMALDFKDPVKPFKDAFYQLLAPKTLLDPDPRDQTLRYVLNEQILPLSSLSSGEREVVNIAFDFILRGAEDSVVFFDEPELHLHPELSYKLLQTLRALGRNNQFILSTHSPDIISSSLDNTVVFLSPPKEPPSNQAIIVREEDATNQALRLLGQSIGIVALGRRIVLVEGRQSSLDKQVYGAVLRDLYPNLVLVPSGGKDTLTSFSTLLDNVLSKTVWGVDFFMLCDRDALPPGADPNSMEAKSQGRLRVMKRYHLENYFLDETVLAAAFEHLMQPDGSWTRKPSEIRAALKELALKSLSYAVALKVSAEYRRAVGNIDIMPKDCNNQDSAGIATKLTGQADSERTRVAESLDAGKIAQSAEAYFKTLSESLSSDTDVWKEEIPGRPILNSLAGRSGIPVGNLKQAYIHVALKQGLSPFQELTEIFGSFDSIAKNQ